MILSLDELDKFFIEFDKKIKNKKNIIVLLIGDLASGKTTFVKKYLEYKKIKENVTSPTFSIQQIYKNNFFHYDLYNKNLDEFIALGLLEEFEKDGIHFVEWGNEELKQILKDFGFDTISIKINKKEDKREYDIKS